MCASNVIPDRVHKGFLLFTQARPDIVISKQLHRSEGLGVFASEFVCVLSVPPNSAGIPEKVDIRVVIDDAFPFSVVGLFPLDPDVRAFPHQDASTGKLCLKDTRLAPISEERLAVYVKWAEEWLSDATTGSLLVVGDPYELPDFSAKNQVKFNFEFNGKLIFQESAESFREWYNYIGQTGTVNTLTRDDPNSLFAVAFLDKHSTPIRSTDFKLHNYKVSDYFKSVWVLVHDVCFFRNRPPQNLEELDQVLRKSSTSLNAEDLLRAAWKNGGGKKGVSAFLVGWPISDKVGNPPVRIHWKAIVFQCYDSYKKTYIGRISRKKLIPSILWPEFRDSSFKSLHWISEENLATEELHSRSRLKISLRTRAVGVIGCGAIGSHVTEHLVRGGVKCLRLFDGDILEYGNLARHTLAGWDVSQGKSEALAEKARSINPLADIKAFSTHIPSARKDTESEKTMAAINECDLYIDCSTSDDAEAWLNANVSCGEKRLALMFIDYYAEHVTLCVSGRNTRCSKVAKALYSDLQSGLTPVDWDHYSRPSSSATAVFIPSPGCWHTTFPALLVDIQALVACAIRELDNIIDKPIKCGGTGIILRRNSGESAMKRGLIEIAWIKEYR
jgi:hypothetical protein